MANKSTIIDNKSRKNKNYLWIIMFFIVIIITVFLYWNVNFNQNISNNNLTFSAKEKMIINKNQNKIVKNKLFRQIEKKYIKPQPIEIKKEIIGKREGKQANIIATPHSKLIEKKKKTQNISDSKITISENDLNQKFVILSKKINVLEKENLKIKNIIILHKMRKKIFNNKDYTKEKEYLLSNNISYKARNAINNLSDNILNNNNLFILYNDELDKCKSRKFKKNDDSDITIFQKTINNLKNIIKIRKIDENKSELVRIKSLLRGEGNLNNILNIINNLANKECFANFTTEIKNKKNAIKLLNILESEIIL